VSFIPLIYRGIGFCLNRIDARLRTERPRLHSRTNSPRLLRPLLQRVLLLNEMKGPARYASRLPLYR
jgi:hypothetical protein